MNYRKLIENTVIPSTLSLDEKDKRDIVQLLDILILFYHLNYIDLEAVQNEV